MSVFKQEKGNEPTKQNEKGNTQLNNTISNKKNSSLISKGISNRIPPSMQMKSAVTNSYISNMNQSKTHDMLTKNGNNVKPTIQRKEDDSNTTMLDMSSFGGFITGLQDGLSKFHTGLTESANTTMDNYVNGIIDENNPDFQAALSWYATQGQNSEISKTGTIGGYDYDQYDKEILAFSNYWYDETKPYADSMGFQNYSLSPDTIKAFGMTESNLGNSPQNATNAQRDIFQAVDPRNTAIDALSGYSKEGSVQGIPQGGYGAIHNLYQGGNVGNDNSFMPTAVTPTLSICFGTRYLAYRSTPNYENPTPDQLQHNLYTGVERYNGGGDPEYVIKTKVAEADPSFFLKNREDIAALESYLKSNNIPY